MNARLQQVLLANDVCNTACQELEACLRAERAALIQLKTDDIASSNLLKESLSRRLKERRKDLKRLLHLAFGVETLAGLEEKLTGEEKKQCTQARESWRLTWEKTRDLCEKNQEFLKHSLRNLSLMQEHLKALLGGKQTYNPYGKSVNAAPPGKVVRAVY